MERRIIVLVGSADAAFHARVWAVSDRVELLTGADLRERPEILPEIEVAFGGLPREDIPAAARCAGCRRAARASTVCSPLSSGRAT